MSDELKPLSKKHQRVLDEYLECWVQWRAYKKVYPNVTVESARAAAHALFTNINFSAHLQARLDEFHMSADKALKNLSEIADADMGVFWKVVDEWMFNPLPEYEVLDEKEVEREKDDGTKEKVVSYRVRHAVLDMDKVTDPRYSHLIHEFSNSRRRGLSIKTYSRHDAIRDVLKIHGKFTERVKLEVDGDLNVIRIIEHKDE